MNPHVILFKIFLLISLGNSVESPKQKGFTDFVVKKQSTFYPILGQKSHDLSLQTSKNTSGSIMHKVSHKQELAIFCKMEHELMKASGFAIKFRLGDQNYVDQLEGK